MNKRILCMLLTLCMVLCLMPTGVFAEGETTEKVDITGSGTQEDPYLIYTAEGLKVFRDKANGGEQNTFAKLMDDIVLNDGTFDKDGNYAAADGSTAELEKWTPIGTDNNRYNGTFDGNGKTVKGLYVNIKSDEPAGLFGRAVSPKIRNLTIDGSVTGKRMVGGILGFSSGGVIENCTNNAFVTAADFDSEAQVYVGGIAGLSYAKLIGCGNTGKITVKNIAQIANVGGLVGYQMFAITDCYNTGNVSGEAGKLYLGGIAGGIAQGVVSNCFSTGKLDSTGSTTVHLGGIVGLNGILYDLTNNYYLEGTADKACGIDEAGAIDKNTVKSMPKEAFGDGTILNLMINGREDGTHPWNGECAYVESAGMVLPILKREESIYVHTHCVCGTGTKFDGHDTHTDVTWTPWTKTDRLPTKSGYYFLTDDVIMNIDQTLSSNGVYICLNGYGISVANGEDESNNPALLLNGGTLTVTDCSTKGTVKDLTIYSGKLVIYGGSIPTGGKLTLAESGKLVASGNAVINGNVINKGTISGGIFNGEVVNEMGTINGGIFNGKVTSNGGYINNGTFNGVVNLIRCSRSSGSDAVIVNGGTFTKTSTVNNVGSSVYNGTYNGKVTVTGHINPLSSGGMTGFIGGGTFTKTSEVTVLTTNPGNLVGIIHGGDYYGKVKLEGGVIVDFGSTCPVFHESSKVYFTSGYADGGIYYGTEIYGEADVKSGAYCTVVFKTDGGSKVPDQKVLRGKKAAALAENPTKTGYVFGGWLKYGTPYDLTATPFINYYVELTAVWSECDHSGNTANPTCTDSVACTVCGGTIAALGHDFSEWRYDDDEHWKKCSRCEAKNDEDCHNWDSGVITVSATCMKSGKKTYTCDECGATKIESIQASGHNPEREWQHNATHHWHKCLNSYCDAKDDNSKQYGYKEHTGGKATCTEKAVCKVCGEPYGEVDETNHANLRRIEAKAATKDTDGNIEYRYCEDCGKYYSDAAATKEITEEETVIKKSGGDTKSPQTAENGNIVMWLAFLFISGGVCTALTVKNKKSNRIGGNAR